MQTATLQPVGTLELTFHSDPGHGWLQVPHSLIYELGIQDQISTFSYMDDMYAYLEEDCDLGVLMRALEAKGLEIRMKERCSPEDDSPIRRLRAFCPKAMATPTGLLDLTVFVEFDVEEASGACKRVQDVFNWQVSPTEVRTEIPQRIRDEVERQSKFGWLVDKRLVKSQVTGITLNTKDHRYLGFPVPGVLYA
jgi:hypothetical protein